MSPLRERDIERRLVERVKELGGEVRKVKWVGRGGAPDRLVMLPYKMLHYKGADGVSRSCVDNEGQSVTIWVELKAPGKAATFPANAHERKQAREHKRMRHMGQYVVVVDSFEGIEEILA